MFLKGSALLYGLGIYMYLKFPRIFLELNFLQKKIAQQFSKMQNFKSQKY